MLTSVQRARTEIAPKSGFSMTGDKTVQEEGGVAAWAELIAKYAGTDVFGSAAPLVDLIRDQVLEQPDEAGLFLQREDLCQICADDVLADLIARCAGGTFREHSNTWDFDRRGQPVRLEIDPDTVACFARDLLPIVKLKPIETKKITPAPIGKRGGREHVCQDYLFWLNKL